MSRMIFDLTDEDRAFLEAVRAQRGLRSHAETLRQLIRAEVSTTAARIRYDAARAQLAPYEAPGRAALQALEARVNAPKTFAPHPKPAKGKRR